MRMRVLWCSFHRQMNAFLRQALLCILVLSSLIGESANALVCRRAQADRVSFQNLLANRDHEFGADFYSSQQHINKFWAYHKRFGFIRTKDGRILLVTKNRRRAAELIDELRRYSGQMVAEARQVEDSPVYSGLSFDVSSIVGPLIREKLDVQTRSMGPNCWNVCLVHAGILKSFRFTSDEEATHWFEGPMGLRIRAMDDLKPGDIFAFSSRGESMHGAVSISPNLVLSKTGADEAFGYRLMDVRELTGFFNDTKPGLKVYRLKTLQEMLDLPGFGWPPELLAHWKMMDAFESQLEGFYFGRGDVQSRQLVFALNSYLKNARPHVIAEIRRLSRVENRTEAENLILHVWLGLRHRMDSLDEAGILAASLPNSVRP
jgi:hypothetical protein